MERRSRGEWNAYVARSETPEVRRQRLEEVPAEWRESVANHVRTFFALRKKAMDGGWDVYRRLEKSAK